MALPNLYWSTGSMDQLRLHPRCIALPGAPDPSVVDAGCCRFVRQDSSAWRMLHTGVLTTSCLKEALGFSEQLAAKQLRNRNNSGHHALLDVYSDLKVAPVVQAPVEANLQNILQHVWELNRKKTGSWKHPHRGPSVHIDPPGTQAARVAHSTRAAARGLQSVRMSWGTVQEPASLHELLEIFPDSVLQEVGLHFVDKESFPSSWGLSPHALPALGASPDAVIVHHCEVHRSSLQQLQELRSSQRAAALAPGSWGPSQDLLKLTLGTVNINHSPATQPAMTSHKAQVLFDALLGVSPQDATQDNLQTVGGRPAGHTRRTGNTSCQTSSVNSRNTPVSGETAPRPGEASHISAKSSFVSGRTSSVTSTAASTVISSDVSGMPRKQAWSFKAQAQLARLGISVDGTTSTQVTPQRSSSTLSTASSLASLATPNSTLSSAQRSAENSSHISTQRTPQNTSQNGTLNPSESAIMNSTENAIASWTAATPQFAAQSASRSTSQSTDGNSIRLSAQSSRTQMGAPTPQPSIPANSSVSDSGTKFADATKPGNGTSLKNGSDSGTCSAAGSTGERGCPEGSSGEGTTRSVSAADSVGGQGMATLVLLWASELLGWDTCWDTAADVATQAESTQSTKGAGNGPGGVSTVRGSNSSRTGGSNRNSSIGGTNSNSSTGGSNSNSSTGGSNRNSSAGGSNSNSGARRSNGAGKDVRGVVGPGGGNKAGESALEAVSGAGGSRKASNEGSHRELEAVNRAGGSNEKGAGNAGSVHGAGKHGTGGSSSGGAGWATEGSSKGVVGVVASGGNAAASTRSAKTAKEGSSVPCPTLLALCLLQPVALMGWGAGSRPGGEAATDKGLHEGDSRKHVAQKQAHVQTQQLGGSLEKSGLQQDPPLLSKSSCSSAEMVSVAVREVVEVKNTCPFDMDVHRRGAKGGKTAWQYVVRDRGPRENVFPLWVPQLQLHMLACGCASGLLVSRSCTKGVTVFRLYRDDAYIMTMLLFVSRFYMEYVKKNVAPPKDMFYKDSAYRRFLTRTLALAGSAQVVVRECKASHMKGASSEPFLRVL